MYETYTQRPEVYSKMSLRKRDMDDEARREALGEDWCMEVTDDHGLLLFRLDFHVTDAPAISRGT